jgi:hypothetical protein
MGLLVREAPSGHTGYLFSLRSWDGEIEEREAWFGLPRFSRQDRVWAHELLLLRVRE